MDSQTRHALKQDKFVQATQSSAGWVSSHRTTVIRWSVAGVIVLALLITGIVILNQRSEAAATALGAAMDVYTAPLAQPGAPAQRGIYTSAAERSKAANQLFIQVASQFGWLPEGGKAHYFAGLTYEELGQNASAETELKAAAGAWDGNLASLARFALANFYHQSGREAQAIEIFNALIAKPTETVSAYTAQLALADLYATTGKKDLAKQLWAKVKDADKAGSAGSLAAQKLTTAK